MIKRPSNQFWFKVHGWIGVQLGILLFVILFSGTLATVAHEIDWLLNPAFRATPPDRPVPYEKIVEQVSRTYPGKQIGFVYAPRGPYFAVEVQLMVPGAEDFTEGLRRVYVNPNTGEIQGVTGWLTVQRALRNFHMALSLPVIGLYVVGALGFFLLASVITALLFDKNWWQRFFVLRRNKGTRIFWSDVHRTTGLWSMWFTIIIAITGIWYFVEIGILDAGLDGFDEHPGPAPIITDKTLVGYGPDPKRVSMDRMFENIHAAYPGFITKYIYFPKSPNEPMRFVGQADAWMVRDRGNSVYANPYTGEVMAIYKAEEFPFTNRWVHTADPLHFGDFGGLTTKLIWFVFGLISSGLSLTGVFLYYRRVLTTTSGSAKAGASV